MATYFAYARVSTPRQGEKGVSLHEQRAAIERYAAIHSLEISSWFEEQQSASQTGRPQFLQMLQLLRKGAAQGVIIHKIDRSVRNLQDWVDVEKLADAGVEVRFANENVDLKTVGGRLSADIQAVIASHYSRNLREEVKKGLYGRLKQGYYPFRAPIGYLDQGSAKTKVVDPMRGPLIEKAFTLYRSGIYSLPHLAETLHTAGLLNLNGGTVSVNGLATILKNPFYVGLIRIYKTGELYKGNHDPLVSTEVFEDVQDILAGKRVDRMANQVRLFSRIVRCGSCGYSLIAERQKGHVYYRCHDRAFKNPPKCPTTCVREEYLEDAVLTALRSVELNAEEVELAKAFLERIQQETETNRVATENALRLQADQLQTRVAKLTDFLIDGTVDKGVFEEKRKALFLEQAKITELLQGNSRGMATAQTKLAKTVELAKSASMLYRRAFLAEKRRLLKILLSNLTIVGKTVEITLAPPYRTIAAREKSEDGRPYRGTCRTWEHIIKQLLTYFEKQANPVN
jgi:DNA invertase Pin-like site-specific DNA recombinase